MTTYLGLCQKVARESGVLGGGGLPASVVGQSGPALDVVEAVASAWTDIQNSQADWRFLESEFEKEITAGTARYTAAGLSIQDFGSWIETPETMSIHATAIGRSDEAPLRFIDYRDWRRTYDYGVAQTGKPVHVAVSPREELVFGKTPDQSYRVRGLYRRTPQVLAANDDVPIMPDRFHDVIAYAAAMKFGAFNEDATAFAEARRNHDQLMGDLRRSQLPKIRTGGPLA